MRPPPPMPVKARNMVSCSTDWERDEAREPTKKTARPMRRMSLRDQMSDRRPYRSWPTVDVLRARY